MSPLLAAVLTSAFATSAFADPVAPAALPPATTMSQSPPQPSPSPPQPSAMAAPAAVPQPAPPPSAVPAPTPEQLQQRRVVVHMDATKNGVVLERRVSVKEEAGAFVVIPFRATDSTWEQVCVAPCSVDLDRFSTYRVSAQNNVAGSKNFTLPQGVDAMSLHVKTHSLAVHRAAEAMGTAGVAAIIVGASLLFTASDFRNASDARLAGGLTGGAGIALAAIGIPLAIATRTSVTGSTNEEVADVYATRGHKVPFLPEINLGHGFTLAQRGIIF